MSLVTDLPAIFDQFSEARQKGFLTVMDLKERGILLVGTYCTFMPQEIPMAAGAVVVSLCSTSDETIEEAEKDLPRNLCPLIKSSYGFGKTDKCFVKAVASHGQVKDFFIIVRVWSANCFKRSSGNVEHLNLVVNSQVFCMIVIAGN